MGAVAFKNRATMFALGHSLLDSIAPANDTTPVAEYRWIHCANEGEYRGHHQGEFELTREVFERFVANFRGDPQYKLGKLELPDGTVHEGGVRPVIQFDYEHASEMPPWEGSIAQSGAPAPGWVLDVAIRNGSDGEAQLWAFAQLGAQIRGQISRKEILFVSIAFTLEATHWITGAPIGPCLTSVAFTNHPFMRDLEPLAASARTRAGLQPSTSSSEAPGVQPPIATGATMTAEEQLKALRARVCKALKIHTLADDEQIGQAVEEASAASADLQAILTALDVKASGDALKSVADLRSAYERGSAAIAELGALLQQDQAADAGVVAPQDVGAAMAAQKIGASAQKALLAYRESKINEEIQKLGDSPSVSKVRAAREAGRKAFLTEYGVADPSKVHLTRNHVAGPGGVQLETQTTPRVLPAADEQRDEAGTPIVDVKGLRGRNTTEKLRSYLESKEGDSFKRLSDAEKIKRVSAFRKTIKIVDSGASIH